MHGRQVRRPENPLWFVSVTVSSHLFLNARGLIEHRIITDESHPVNRGRGRRCFLALHLLMGERSGRVALRIGRVSCVRDVVLLVQRAMGGAQLPLMHTAACHDHVLQGRPRTGLVVPQALRRRHPSLVRKCRSIGLDIVPNGSREIPDPTVPFVRTVESTILELSYDLGTFTPSRLLDFSDIVGETVSMRSERNALWLETRPLDAC